MFDAYGLEDNDTNHVMAQYGRKESIKSYIDRIGAKYETEALNRNALNTKRDNLRTKRLVAFITLLFSLAFLVWSVKRAKSGADAFNGVTFFIQSFLAAGLFIFCLRYYFVSEITYRMFMEKAPFKRYVMLHGIQTHRNMYNYYSDIIMEYEKILKPYKRMLKKIEEGKELDEKETALLDNREGLEVRVKVCPYREENVKLYNIFSYLKG